MNESKPHYLVLDGLRGVAALMVILYHLFEAVAFAAGASEQKMFHGFLAVDFFFILSGFVMGYAYDGKWDRMGEKRFFLKRLVRLHPMVIIGAITGLVVFCCQGGMSWDGSSVSIGRIVLSVVLALFLLPSPAFCDVRGNTELFPLNGPHWSLFFEYLGNVIYALALRKLSTKALKIWVAVSAVALSTIGLAGPEASLSYGWSSVPTNMLGGFLRMNFSYTAGLLLVRLFRERKADEPKKGRFLLCTALLVAVLCIPSLGKVRMLFELFAVIIVFPFIVWLAARAGTEADNRALRFLGELSYPLYAIHYPFIYLYIGWINKGIHPFGTAPWTIPVAVAVICIIAAALCLYLYEKPVRKYLSNRLVK